VAGCCARVAKLARKRVATKQQLVRFILRLKVTFGSAGGKGKALIVLSAGSVRDGDVAMGAGVW
jgi:hypothetical protein